MAFLRVSKPITIEYDNTIKVLCSVISDAEGKNKEIWYELDKKYKKHAVMDRVDAFVVALLPFCFINGLDIIVDDDTSVSKELLFQLNNVFIPSLYLNPNFKNIRIKAKVNEEVLESEKHVGMGLSRGVDCLYTLFKTMNEIPVDIVTLLNVQAFSDNGSEQGYELFCEDCESAERFIEDYYNHYGKKLELVKINSNIQREYYVPIHYGGTFRDIAPIMLIQKLVSYYYVSSTVGISDFSIVESSRHYEPWTLYNFSTNALRFQLFGNNTKRIEKIEYISGFDLSYNYLNVCRKKAYDASKKIRYDGKFINCTNGCEKCLRTVAALVILNKVKNYEAVFDAEWIYRNLSQIEAMIEDNKDKYYWKEIYDAIHGEKQN